MKLRLENFGGVKALMLSLDDKRFVMPNGSGKTSIVNAFHWLFTGKTIAGFAPIHKGATQCRVTLMRFPFYGGVEATIERSLQIESGTSTLQVNGMIYTQTAFEADLLRETGVSIDLVRACATPTCLTYQSLTTEDLQRILVSVGAMNGDELKELKAKQKRIREAMTRAEANSMVSVEVPEVVTEVSPADALFLKEFKSAQMIEEKGAPEEMVCPCCGQPLPEEQRIRNVEAYNAAVLFCQENVSKAVKVQALIDQHNEEVQANRVANLMIEQAKVARKDYEDYKKQLDDVTKQIQTLQETYVGTQLPEDVELETEERLKNGKTKPCCKLTYKGLSLKTVNYAKRVEICVELVDAARRACGATDVIPILLDNGESVEGLHHIENLIRFEVPAYEMK